MSTENLYNREAIEKLQKLVDKIDIGMVCTNPENTERIHAVPMSHQEVDDEGNIWFLFSSESETYQNLQRNKNISVLFSDVKDYNFVNVHGQAEISGDALRIDKYWNKMVEAWFERGKDDPRIRVLKVKVKDAHYWDTKTNKYVTFLKMVTSALTGNDMDEGREGNLNV